MPGNEPLNPHSAELDGCIYNLINSMTSWIVGGDDIPVLHLNNILKLRAEVCWNQSHITRSYNKREAKPGSKSYLLGWWLLLYVTSKWWLTPNCFTQA